MSPPTNFKIPSAHHVLKPKQIYLLRAAIEQEQVIPKPTAFKYINILRSVSTLTLYKGYRSLTSTSLLIVHYATLPSKYLKQILLKLRSNHVLALLLPNNLKLNVISIDLFDYILTPGPNSVEMPYSSAKLSNTLGIDLTAFLHQINITQLSYVNLLPNLQSYTKEHFQQKIPIASSFKGQIYCFFGQELTLSLASQINRFVGSNQRSPFRALKLDDIINEGIANSLQLSEEEQWFREMEKGKVEIKQKWKKVEEPCVCAEKRIEKQIE